jgi:hypothetical protein
VHDGCADYDTCFDIDQCWPAACDSNPDCYWDDALSGDCVIRYWSATAVPDYADFAWYVDFYSGAVGSLPDTTDHNIRCVSTP